MKEEKPEESLVDTLQTFGDCLFELAMSSRFDDRNVREGFLYALEWMTESEPRRCPRRMRRFIHKLLKDFSGIGQVGLFQVVCLK